MTPQPRCQGLAAVHGFVAIFDPDGPDQAARARLRHIGDGHIAELDPVAVASLGLTAVAWWSNGSCTCVLDGALHDRERLAEELELPPACSDPHLAAAAWMRWGAGAPARLRGTYAYVAWDNEQRRGFVAQDHLGGRSIFVLRDGPRWIVASELRLALEAAARRPAPDARGVLQWLGGRVMRGGQMLHRDVRRYGGAHAGVIADHGIPMRPYWAPRYQGPLDVTAEEAAGIMREALRTAIRRRVRPREQIGTLLSGGIDSTVIAAGIAHWCADLDPDHTAYSMVMPDDPWEDESPYVDAATRDLKLPGWRVIPSGHGALWHALWYQDAFALPLATPGTVLDWDLVRLAAEDGADAMLDGQGGDEVFGHEPYLLADLARRGRWASVWRLLHETPYAGAQPARWQLKSMLRCYVFRGNTPGWYDAARPDEQEDGVYPYLRPELVGGHPGWIDPFAWKRRGGPRWWAHLADSLTELRDVYWVSDLLRRRGRLEGIESRSPLLDVDLAETVMRLPPRYAFDSQFDRALVRDALRGVLPEPVRVRRRKSNYGRANHNWLVRLVPAFDELLGSADAEVGAYVDRGAVRKLLTDIPGDRDPEHAWWGPHLWTLATAELWLRAEAGRSTEVASIVARTAPPCEWPVAAPWRAGRSRG